MRKLFIIALFGLAVSSAKAQSCTPSVPCVPVTINNGNVVPSSTVLWWCMGSATTCSQSALDSAKAGQSATNLCPTNPSAWKCTQFTQSKTPQNYNDPEPWGSLMNYSSQGTSGGGVSATAPIATFQVPNAPAQSPSISVVSPMVTTGNSGIQ